MNTRNANVTAHLATFTKGYANARTLATFLAKFDDAIDSNSLRGNLDIVTLPNGRLQPVLVFGPTEQVATEAIMLAHSGMPLYQHRPDGRPYGA